MMQVDFDFSPSRMRMIRQAADMPAIVLLSGIKICVNKRAPIAISPPVDNPRILSAPAFHSLFLLAIGRPSPASSGNNRWFKVIGKRDDEVNFSLRPGPGKLLPRKRGNNTGCISNLLPETHLWHRGLRLARFHRLFPAVLFGIRQVCLALASDGYS